MRHDGATEDDGRVVAGTDDRARAGDPRLDESSRLEQTVPSEKLPRHVAIIMDGNGRWARRRGLLRASGHERGAEALRRVTTRARELGVRELTFYALSSENYSKRPRAEVAVLMRLLKAFLVRERPELLDNDIRLRAIGDVEALPADVLATLRETERLTESGGTMVLRLALNYGSRQEILRAVGNIVGDVVAGRLAPEDVPALGEDGFRRYLYDPDMSDPDLLIRTASEFRLSNFLLWQCSYSELWVTDCLWPDIDETHFNAALAAYGRRERKYGAVGRGDG